MLATADGSGGKRLSVECAEVARSSAPGASVAINGVCLTVAEIAGAALAFDVIPESLARSNLGALAPADRVNVEESLRLGAELGGHLVYGHVDATTAILQKDPEGQGFRMWCAMPPALAAMIVEKGYVALDGVSLTVAQAHDGAFAVALIPETLRRTTLGVKGPGGVLNVEADPVARYVAAAVRSMSHRPL